MGRIRKPDHVFEGDCLIGFRRHLVYVWQSENGITMYVGMGASLGRPFSKSHDKMDPCEGDKVLVFFCEDRHAAEVLEARLIHKLKPKLNGRGRRGHGVVPYDLPPRRQLLERIEQLRGLLQEEEKRARKAERELRSLEINHYYLAQATKPYMDELHKKAAETMGRILHGNRKEKDDGISRDEAGVRRVVGGEDGREGVSANGDLPDSSIHREQGGR